MTNESMSPTSSVLRAVRVEKKKRKPRVKASVSLKMVISRTFSEGAKRNIGNYESRDFFCSATRSMEIALPVSSEEVDELSALLFFQVKQDVKEGLRVELEDASGTKPIEGGGSQEEAPSIPDAFTSVPHRETPWNKFKPREDNDDLDALDEVLE